MKPLAHTLQAGVTALAIAVGGMGLARADVIPYSNPGTENPVVYSFTAASTGDVIAYFTGTGASFSESLGMFVNGVLSSSGFGLTNHLSNIGDSFNLGHVNAGDALVFAINVFSPQLSPPYVYSDPSLNGPYDFGTPGAGSNHIYSVAYTATSPIFPGVPAGTYVGFEDLPTSGGSDFNYFDETYVFTNVSSHVVPEPAAMAVLGVGLLGLGMVRRRR
jgi:hypothetical protein